MSGVENVFANPERWAEPTRDGGFVLTDPVSGDRVNPNVPPAWVEEDPYLHAGYEYLRMNGANIGVEIAWGRHRDAEDLGNPQLGWFEKKVAEADYYGFEAHAHSIVFEQRRQYAVQRRRHALLLQGRDDVTSYVRAAVEQTEDPDTFSHRVNYAAARARSLGTVSFAADAARDGRPVERDFCEAFDTLFERPSTPAVSMASLNMIIHREWFTAGKTGLTMLEHEIGKSPYRDINAFITFGGLHKALEDKYRSLNVGVPRKFKLRPEIWDTPGTEVFSVAARTGLVIARNLPWFKKFHQQVAEGHEQIQKLNGTK